MHLRLHAYAGEGQAVRERHCDWELNCLFIFIYSMTTHLLLLINCLLDRDNNNNCSYHRLITIICSPIQEPAYFFVISGLVANIRNFVKIYDRYKHFLLLEKCLLLKIQDGAHAI